MQARFCQECNTLLRPSTTSDTLTFHCARCYISYPSTPSDTLFHRKTTMQDINQFEGLIRDAAISPTVKLVNSVCPHCKGKISARLILGDEMQIIHVCRTCHKTY
jgi:DNA-directed RNA polymerase subunit M/transcription elongation factor TFIIS